MGFICIKTERDGETRFIELKQTGLTGRIIGCLGFYVGTEKNNWMPAEYTPLVKYEYGEPPTGCFSYRSVIGMILYLGRNSRPDISYAVHCAAYYMLCPKHLHELALKIIGWYLKLTRGGGLLLNPFPGLNIDFYPYAGFL